MRRINLTLMGLLFCATSFASESYQTQVSDLDVKRSGFTIDTLVGFHGNPDFVNVLRTSNIIAGSLQPTTNEVMWKVYYEVGTTISGPGGPITTYSWHELYSTLWITDLVNGLDMPQRNFFGHPGTLKVKVALHERYVDWQNNIHDYGEKYSTEDTTAIGCPP